MMNVEKDRNKTHGNRAYKNIRDEKLRKRKDTDIINIYVTLLQNCVFGY
jgi:hypothetical protein